MNLKISKLLLLALAGAFFLSSANAEEKKIGFNLAGLEYVSVKINAQHLLKQETLTRLRTEIQLKLKTAGLKLKSEPDSKTGTLYITAHGIKGIVLTPVAVELSLLETVTVNRGKNPNAMAVTFRTEKMRKMKNTDKEIYQMVMDKLLPRFIAKYLEQNT